MFRTIYLIILAYFIFGGMGFYFINKKRSRQKARENQVKLFTYFIIINILFFSIVINPVVFRFLAAIIIIIGFYELFRLFRDSGYGQPRIFIIYAMSFAVIAACFFFFSMMEKKLMLFSVLIVSIFDSFSQITGQLWGKRKLFPAISPAKTVGGLVGGSLIGIVSAILLCGLTNASHLSTVAMAAGIMIFAFFGDISFSFYKRRYNVKDFSRLIPGHGGVLDRFDSLITGGAWVAVSGWLLN